MRSRVYNIYSLVASILVYKRLLWGIFFLQMGDPSQQKLGGAAGLSTLPPLSWAPVIKWQILDVVLVLLKAVKLVPGSPLSTGGHTQKRMCVSLQSDQKYICAVRIAYRGADNICLIPDSNDIRVRR